MRHKLMILVAFALVMVTEGHAGPCTAAIDVMQSQIDARINAIAGSGPSAPESRAATMHHQPTPGSIVAEESRLGEGAKMEAALAARARARSADSAADITSCERALADAQAAIL